MKKKTYAIVAVAAILSLGALSHAPAAPLVPDKEPPAASETAKDSSEEGYGQDKRAACVTLPDGTVFGIVMTKATDWDRQESVSTVQMFQRPESDAFVKKTCRKLETNPERVKARSRQSEIRWFVVEY